MTKDKPELDTYSGTIDCRECKYMGHASINQASISGCAHKLFPQKVFNQLDDYNWPYTLAKICNLFEGNMNETKGVEQ